MSDAPDTIKATLDAPVRALYAAGVTPGEMSAAVSAIVADITDENTRRMYAAAKGL